MKVCKYKSECGMESWIGLSKIVYPEWPGGLNYLMKPLP